jgi:hypothetical protein
VAQEKSRLKGEGCEKPVAIVWVFLKKTLTDHLRCLGYLLTPLTGLYKKEGFSF